MTQVRFGSILFGLVRFDSSLYGSVYLGSVRFVSVRFGPVRSDPVRSGSVRLGSVRFLGVRFGSNWFDSVQLLRGTEPNRTLGFEVIGSEPNPPVGMCKKKGPNRDEISNREKPCLRAGPNEEKNELKKRRAELKST